MSDSRILYFDCFSGISGDMTIGALLDTGIDQDEFVNKLNRIGVDGFRIEIKKKQVKTIVGTDFNVIIDHCHDPVKRNLSDVEKIIEESGLDESVIDLSKKIFKKIALAEATVHGTRVEDVHFHEVGAVDSIVDIIGTALCIEMLHVERIVSSPIHLGTGSVECNHGVLPVPVPATVEILKETPLYSTGVKGELVTPTGAAIIKTIADDFDFMPQMEIEKIGYGTGKRDYGITNVLRVFLGKERKISKGITEKLIMLETNIDDMNPEIHSYLVPLLFKKGALDVFLTNIIMKKGRPATMLSVLSRYEDYHELEDIILRETTTLGMRKYPVERDCLERKTITIATQFGEVTVKSAYKDGRLIKIAPEYEECKRIALEKRLPLRIVYDSIIKETFGLVQQEREE